MSVSLLAEHILLQTGSILVDIVSKNKQLTGSVTHGIYCPPSIGVHLILIVNMRFTRHNVARIYQNLPIQEVHMNPVETG